MTLLAVSSFVVPYVDRLADHGKLLASEGRRGSKGSSKDRPPSVLGRTADAFLHRCTVRLAQYDCMNRCQIHQPNFNPTDRCQQTPPRCRSDGSGTSTPSPASGLPSSSGLSTPASYRSRCAHPRPADSRRCPPSSAWCFWRRRPCADCGSPCASSSTATRGCTWLVRGHKAADRLSEWIERSSTSHPPTAGYLVGFAHYVMAALSLVGDPACWDDHEPHKRQRQPGVTVGVVGGVALFVAASIEQVS